MPKVLTCGRGRGKFPLANWTSVSKGCGPGLNSRCDVSEGPPLINSQDPNADRNQAIVVPPNRVQTYEGDLAPGQI